MAQSDNNYVDLLSMYNKLHDKNEEKKKLGIHDYSLMNALLKKTDEVNLHSNFIYSMINPKANHYRGHIFLELFFKAIGEDGFLDLDNARVHKEKGKIDLLIEDGEKVIIIENKLNAVDQPYQISRYIQYSIENYLGNCKESLGDKLRVVYLSEYKSKPDGLKSKSGKDLSSIRGFTIDKKSLKWEGTHIYEEIKHKEKVKEALNLNLPTNTSIKFNRVQHSQELLKWVEASRSDLVNEKNEYNSLIYAFYEYETILIRLDKNRKKEWRNIMSLDEYTVELKEEEEQKKMYAFMCEANSTLNDYLSQKLWDTLDKTYGESMQILKFTGHDEFKLFTVDSCKAWFHKKGESKKWKETGFMISDKYFFALGVDNISYGLVSKGWKANIKTNRKKLQTNQELNIFTLIENIKEKVKKDN